MAYQALYRKFRPDRFEDVKGQDAIVTTLKNQITADRVGHAYLFCGTRGTGKTTVAKLFAKAVNCENRQEDGSPCGECPTCKSIAAGTSMNVIEIDAASNNGVDNIREIRDEVAYRPTEGRFKVYIIDEVHMLSIGAFNALLKTLEEPPSYVIFILATTEVNKIPITILSRCQRYDFHRMTIDTMVNRMRELADTENMQVEDKALRFVAKCADGSMRDALSLLDQCMAFNYGQLLTYDKALDVLGAVDNSVYGRFLDQILDRNVTGAISILEEVIMQGRELTAFVSDFTWYLRNLLLVSTSDENMEDVIDVSTETLNVLKEEAKLVNADTLMRFIRIFSELSGAIKYSTQKRVLTEIAVIKLMKPEMETDLASMKQRLENIEKDISKGVRVAAVQAPSATEEQKPRKKVPLPPALPEDVETAIKSWGKMLKKLDGMVATAIKFAHPTVKDDMLMIIFDSTTETNALNLEIANENVEQIQAALNEVVGKDVKFKMVMSGAGKIFDEEYPNYDNMIVWDDIEITDEKE
ncbi:DNA polymerase-3 subunit gamma/tau [Lachnospiraceae bacterium KH1T2]|nr:DNA polymerase-3 subunit gamma/tau [Lachnospiraceae bacterium KH1T2]